MSIILPKNIKYKRNKKYTEKRYPYKSYLKAKWNWEDVFNEIDELKINDNKFFKIISTKYAIKYSTLRHKYNSFCKNKNE